MGTRGPAPNRSDQRRRRNAPEHPIDKPVGAVDAPELDIVNAHPLAIDLYEALKQSVEARYFTLAVWQRARISAQVLSDALNSGKMSSVMYAAIQSDWKDLLISPADQRRLGIEVQRESQVDPEEERVVAQLDEYRERFSS